MRSLEDLSATPKCATTTEYVEYFVAVPLGKAFPLSGAKFPDLNYARKRCSEEKATIIEQGMEFVQPFTTYKIYVKK